jgi:hypothetical protein
MSADRDQKSDGVGGQSDAIGSLPDMTGFRGRDYLDRREPFFVS